jgi:C_GCAxxG_C_C family probable redox protein
MAVTHENRCEEESRMGVKEASDYGDLKKRVQMLARGPEDRAEVEARFRQLSEEGLPEKTLEPARIIAQKEKILDRVQARAEAYEQVSQSCAKSSALALMEEFGLGCMDVIRALSPFPGIALTGETCGGVIGSMAALGLYFGRNDLLNYGANARAYGQCRKFLERFEKTLGTTKCREIHERVVFGTFHNTADPEHGYPAFLADKGFEKCGLPPGVGARIAAEIIIEDLEKGES